MICLLEDFMTQRSKDDEKKRDETLKRMLLTPHKPHVAKKKPAKKVPKRPND